MDGAHDMGGVPWDGPVRPEGTGGWSEERLAELVTRDSMIGTGLPKQPHEVA